MAREPATDDAPYGLTATTVRMIEDDGPEDAMTDDDWDDLREGVRCGDITNPLGV